MVAVSVVFMGTPDFAVPALNALAVNDYSVKAVFCQPDRPRGRSRKPLPCPVKQAALDLSIEVHQPKRIRAKKWVALLRELAPDVIVVAAFGQILPRSILDIPRIDCINIHASLLPRWRGASPIHHAILEGDAETGVGIMRMEEALDAGPVYASQSIPIEAGTSKDDLETKLAAMGADLLLRCMPKLSTMEPVKQDENLVTYAPIIQKDDGQIDFTTMDAARIERMTRAYAPWPGVYGQFRGNPLKVQRARITGYDHQAEPGSILTARKKDLTVACAQGTVLALETVQPAGKKAMDAAAFNNGYRPEPGESLAIV